MIPNPWVILATVGAFILSNGAAYWKGSSDGAKGERLEWMEADRENADKLLQATIQKHEREAQLKDAVFTLERQHIAHTRVREAHNESTRVLASQYAEVLAQLPDGQLWLGECWVRQYNASAQMPGAISGPAAPCLDPAGDWAIAVDRPAEGFVTAAYALEVAQANNARYWELAEMAKGLQEYAQTVASE